MSPLTPQDVPVLIVGAGPAGLTAAMTLSLHGVPSLLVDRRDGTGALPRATGLSTRTMELLRSWGLEDAVRAGGADVSWRGWACASLAAAGAGRPFDLGLPTAEQSAIVSPTTPACVPQDHLEPVLLDTLAGLGWCEVRWDTELVALHDGDDGAEATVRDRVSGTEQLVRARYVVGADGAHSAVRRALGIAMHGPDRLAECATALFRAPLWDLVGERRHGIYDTGAGVVLPAGGDRWLFGAMWQPGRRPEGAGTHAWLLEALGAAIGDPSVAPTIERAGEFTFAAQLAERFTASSTFLAGDAAHRVTPRGGTGLNTAIADGHDLGWRLAWVLSGWAGPALLDGYERERRPVAAHNVHRSAQPSSVPRDAVLELHVDLGGRIAHVWVAKGVSTLDLLGPGYTLLTGPDAAPWEAAAAALPGPVPLRVRALHAVAARAVGLTQAGALLVRPDGVPAGRWAAAHGAERSLRAAVDHPAAEPSVLAA
jgi:2-polyprenyl-6-methoxyphenol hydroxylase-like FAD-dependent oxidoreductase